MKPSAPSIGAAIFAHGKLPMRCDTVMAEVLALLLAGNTLTALDAVGFAGTTRLAVAVHELEKAHGWRIDRELRAVSCRDGRAALVAHYWLLPGIINTAMQAGAAQWCETVREARALARGRSTNAAPCGEAFRA